MPRPELSKQRLLATFPYEAEVRLSHERRYRKEIYTGFCEIEVDLISGYDAPVVVTIAKEGAATAPQSLRTFDDSLWAPVQVIDRSSALARSGAERFFNQLHQELDCGWVARFDRGRGQANYLSPIYGALGVPQGVRHTNPFATERSFNLETPRAALEKSVDDMLIVDGRLHQKVAEPIWRVTYESEVAVSIFQARVGEVVAYLASDFRIDQLEEARAFASFLAERDPRAPLRDHTYNVTVDIDRPEVLRFDDPKEWQRLMRNLTASPVPGLPQLPAAQLRAWCDFADARAAVTSGAFDGFEKADDALERLLDYDPGNPAIEALHIRSLPYRAKRSIMRDPVRTLEAR